jgi:hypothetical protein
VRGRVILRTSENSVPRKLAEDPAPLGWVLRQARKRAHYCPEVDAHDRNTDIDLQILDLLRQESPKSAYRLAQELTRRAGEEEEALGTHTVRKRLEALASRGLVAGSASAHDAAAAVRAQGPALADPWRHPM